MHVDPGFRAENVLTLAHGDPANEIPERPADRRVLQRLLDRVAAVPGVASAAMINRLPLSGNEMELRFELEDVAGAP